MFDGYAVRIMPLLQGALVVGIVGLIITEVQPRKTKNRRGSILPTENRSLIPKKP